VGTLPPDGAFEARAQFSCRQPSQAVVLSSGDHEGVLQPQDLPEGGVPGDAPAPSAPLPAETWLRIVQVHDRVTRRVDSALHRQHRLSLTGFEALRWIADAPGERATMGEVAEAVGLSRPGVTSTVSRLVADGLVLRERGGPDRRLLHARLTPAGRERFEAAALTHDSLIERLLAVLGDDAGVVTEALARVSRGTARR
jgi:DNA-binding MarR family transcriptional regulator